MTSRLLGKLLILALLVYVALGTIDTVFRPTNCGGNGQALSDCRQFAVLCRAWVDEAASVGGASAPATLGDLVATHGAEDRPPGFRNGFGFLEDYLVLDPRRPVPRGERAVVIVCSEPYGNVPRPTFWSFYRRNVAHAVGYSDGTAGLISPREYAALDLSGFVSAEEWLGR
ncbi:MAG: hypothetical protein HY721_10545 [Planctomycetes bacterium]|nr:hypothetical protein [Planctomycetota bacterium]